MAVMTETTAQTTAQAARTVPAVRRGWRAGPALHKLLVTAHVVLPVGMGALVTGVLLGLGTKWGLLRHYWVAVKLLVKVGLILASSRTSVLSGSIANLVLLVALTVLSVYKPW